MIDLDVDAQNRNHNNILESTLLHIIYFNC